MNIANTDNEAQCDWPWNRVRHIQGGTNGVVFRRPASTVEGVFDAVLTGDSEALGQHLDNSYETAFVEVFMDGDTFLRGEGATVEEAEAAAFAKLQHFEQCPGHEYEARGYKNGAGFCKHCNRFKTQAFTAEELGQFCWYCGVPTMWFWGEYGDLEEPIFGCNCHKPRTKSDDIMDEIRDSLCNDCERTAHHETP